MKDQRRQHRAVWAMVSACLVLSLPAVAFGQEKEQQDQFEGPLKDQLEEYWSVERDLPVIKNRLYTRDGKIELGLYSGLMSSDPFYYYLPIGLHIGYFLTESFGLELSGQYQLSFTTDLTNFFEDERGDSFDVATDGGDEFIFRTNIVAKWHPLYGKVAAFQRKLSHFDFNVVGGLGLVGFNRPSPTRESSDMGFAPEVVFGGGVSFFATKNLTIRLDGRGYLYVGPEFTTDQFTTNDAGETVEHSLIDRLSLPTEFLLGVSYSL